nr:response regulator [uncultured Sphingomonas sp.]
MGDTLHRTTGEGLVYVVDDDQDLREELQELLSRCGYQARAFGDPADFLAQISGDCPLCVLLDVRMPGVDGITVQARLRSIAPLAAVIMLSGHGDIPLAVQATKAGAIDFMEKPVASATLLAAVADALAASEARQRSSRPAEEAAALVNALSQREVQVLRGLVAGLANKVIAYRLDLSQRTVEIYRAKLMRKLKVRSLPAAVQIALAAGLVPLGDEGPVTRPLTLDAPVVKTGGAHLLQPGSLQPSL